MNTYSQPNKGSVLIVTLMTLTVMAFLCATSLYVISQNTNGGMQTAGWQQALTGAESGVDAAIRALNAYASPAPSASAATAWTGPGWIKVTGTTLPATEAAALASPTATASAPPDSSHFNYLPSSQLQVGSFAGSEGASEVHSWVTVDNAAGTLGSWYRVRSVGQTRYPANAAILRWSSMNRLDNELRNTIALKFSRATGLAATQTTQGAARTIEVILSPATSSIWGTGLLLKGALTMSGGGIIDHFNSNNVLTHQYSTAVRSSDYTESVVNTLNANGSNLSSTYVYGAMTYSTTGSAPKNATNVEGGLTSPFSGSPPTTSDPTWTPDVTASSAPTTITVPSNNNSASNPYKYKVTGNFTVPGGKSLTIQRGNNGSSTLYLEIWTTGSLTTSGSGYISADPTIHVTYYVDGSVTTSGSSFNNSTTAQAQNTQIVVVGSGDVTVSGSGYFIGTVEAPNSSITVSGSANLVGALIGNTMNISGGASFHYDDALSSFTGGAAATSNYAFASWFEDNSDVKRFDSHLNRIIY